MKYICETPWGSLFWSQKWGLHRDSVTNVTYVVGPLMLILARKSL